VEAKATPGKAEARRVLSYKDPRARTGWPVTWHGRPSKNSRSWKPTGLHPPGSFQARLGLSEQVPARIVILTDGVPRRVSLGKLTLTFRRAAPRNLLGAGRPAGLVIQALRHLRTVGLEEARLSGLRSRLDQSTRVELAKLTPKLAAWMQPLMTRLTQEEKA